MAMRAEFINPEQTEQAREVAHPLYADYVLDALQAWRAAGLRTALVTLVGINGSSPRPLGSQIAVASDGCAVGAVTGGCAEQAIVLDALTAMANGRNHLELYGKGSRFKDIILPCGSGVYLYFDVTLSDKALDHLVASRAARRLAVYQCENAEGRFERIYRPQTRLLLFGRGNVLPPLAQMTHLNEIETLVFCPDEWTRQKCQPFSQVFPLTSADDWRPDLIDQDTAVVSLFHDHSYEPTILSAALRSNAFYIGALGSQRTHQTRLADLSQHGWGKKDTDRIAGPVGLDIGAKTPPEIAISIIAEIIATYRIGR